MFHCERGFDDASESKHPQRLLEYFLMMWLALEMSPFVVSFPHLHFWDMCCILRACFHPAETSLCNKGLSTRRPGVRRADTVNHIRIISTEMKETWYHYCHCYHISRPHFGTYYILLHLNAISPNIIVT